MNSTTLTSEDYPPALRRLLDDEDIVEVMANADGQLWVDTLTRGLLVCDTTLTAELRERVIRLVADYAGRVCHPGEPRLSARLPGGHRFQGHLPPVVEAPSFTIRKHARRRLTLQDLMRKKTLTPAQADRLLGAIQARHNILIAGGTGSGKTTLMNALIPYVTRGGRRIVTIEDTPELNTPAETHRLALFVRHEVGFGWAEAVQDALRLRPDTIIVGEVRDGAALDMLKAWNTGHRGGLATVHANSARDVPYRLANLVQERIPQVPDGLLDTIDTICFLEHRKVMEIWSPAKEGQSATPGRSS